MKALGFRLMSVATGLALAVAGLGAGQPLGPAGGTPTPEELVGRLGGPNFQDREAAAKALRALGARAVPALKAGLAGGSPEGAERCQRVLTAVRRDELNRFLKAFAADTDRKASFDHPIWVRWSRVAGDDLPSRELFAEVLAAAGAAETLDRLEADPKAAADLYPAELVRLRAAAAPRTVGRDGRSHWSLEACYSIGEAAYGVYLGSYPGATSIKPEFPRAGLPVDPEMEVLESLCHLQYRKRGPWSATAVEEGKYQPGNLPLDRPKNRLFVATLMNLKNPRAVEHALRWEDGGLRSERGDLGFCLPLVRMVCREKSFPIQVRAASWPYLAEAGETDYLPDIAAGQTDATRVQQFWRSDEGKREYNVLVSDVSVACQLILHRKAPKDFGFIAKLNETGRAVDRSCFAYGFPDDETRKAAHAKALALLEKAPPPKSEAPPALADADRVRIAEAFRLAEALGNKVWPDWDKAPFAVLLVTADDEYLVRHPKPSDDFAPAGDDPVLRQKVWTRKRKFSPDLLATFPAVGGVPTVVIGRAEGTAARTSIRWVVTLLHEHFHQLQNSRPRYFAELDALGLARGDRTGMWMLNYPFPYEDAKVVERYAALTKAAGEAIAARGQVEFPKNLAEYMEARKEFRAALKADDSKYVAFQAWQEGVARYTELRVAELAAAGYEPSKAFRELKDYTPFRDEAAAIRAGIEKELTIPLDKAKRTAFYALGAAEGLLLDAVRPDWRKQYFEEKFSLDAHFRPGR